MISLSVLLCLTVWVILFVLLTISGAFDFEHEVPPPDEPEQDKPPTYATPKAGVIIDYRTRHENLWRMK